MNKGRILSVATVVALAGSLSACSSSKTPAAPAAAPAVATTAATAASAPAVQPTSAQPSAPVAPVAFQYNKLNTVGLPTPALLPMNDVFQWTYPDDLYGATVTPLGNGGLAWNSACQDAPTVSAKGWKGTQEPFIYTPKKNFTPSPFAPGFNASWDAYPAVLSFADAASATTATTAMGTANDDCLSRLGAQHLPDVSVKRVATTADGQSWSVTTGGSQPMEVHYYLVHRGSFISTLRFSEISPWNGAPQAYTGTADTDTALLTDMAKNLCGFAGACS